MVIDYAFASKRTLLFVIQKQYYVQLVDLVINCISFGAQIEAILSKNYRLYLSISCIGAIVSNIVLSILVSKQHLYNSKDKGGVSKDYLNRLKRDIGKITINNIAWTGINSTDNIIISSVVGSNALARNANYSSLSLYLTSIVQRILDRKSTRLNSSH